MEVIDREKYFKKKEEMINYIIAHKEYGIKNITNLVLSLSLDIDLNNQVFIPSDSSAIFSKFDIFKENADKYKVFYSLLQKYSFLDGNCMEVAAGFYPRLAEIIAEELEKNHHTLTLCDPEIKIGTPKNAILLKEKFTKETDISDIDTLFAISPCEATIPLAEKAFEEDKNLLLAFCHCNHETLEYQKWIGKYWAEDVCMIFREKYGKEAEIIEWPSYVGHPLPILVRESSKQKMKSL